MAHKTPFKRTNPEAEGISSTAVLDFIRAIEQPVSSHPLDTVHGFMLLRHGNVAAEGWWTPYNPQSPHILYSLSKSFTSSAIGLAVAEGLLTVDDPVLRFFPDEAPANPSENLKAMRVRHLLSMNTGHKEDTTGDVFQADHQSNLFGLASQNKDTDWPRTFLSLPVEHAPGTWFVYNTAATYMLSAIITKLTGESLLDYLRPRLFAPLGIEHPVWETDPQGINLGGTGLHLTTEDIARFGQMYLQQGVWQGQRILPEEWIAEATKTTSDNSNTQTNPDWIVGYGYQFWRCRHNCYRGDGAFGQYCIVMPDQDAVLVINSGLRDMQSILDKVWTHLLPAMQPEPLPINPKDNVQLPEKLAKLSLPVPQGGPSTSGGTKGWGTPYKLESNYLHVETITMTPTHSGSTLVINDGQNEHLIQVGHGMWHKGTSRLRGQGEEPVAASGAWTTEDSYEVRICFFESEVGTVMRFHYTDDMLKLSVEPNVSWVDVTRIELMASIAE